MNRTRPAHKSRARNETRSSRIHPPHPLIILSVLGAMAWDLAVSLLSLIPC
jgi:hypothetical protein